MLGTRASTTDKRTGANLVLDYSLNKDCALVGTSFILKSGKTGPAVEDVSLFGVLQFDNNPPDEVEAKVTREKGSNFIFLSLNNKTFERSLMQGHSLLFNYKGYGLIEFSLAGANAAIKRAKAQCEDFLAPEDKKP